MDTAVNNIIQINPKGSKIVHCKIFKITSRYYRNCNTKDKMHRQGSGFKITPLALLVDFKIIRKANFQESTCNKIIQSFIVHSSIN
jgi:hypothetical protein